MWCCEWKAGVPPYLDVDDGDKSGVDVCERGRGRLGLDDGARQPTSEDNSSDIDNSRERLQLPASIHNIYIIFFVNQ